MLFCDFHSYIPFCYLEVFLVTIWKYFSINTLICNQFIYDIAKLVVNEKTALLEDTLDSFLL